MQRDDYRTKQRVSCVENSKWQSERPGEDKMQSGGRNTVKLEGKAGSIHRRITQRPQLLGE